MEKHTKGRVQKKPVKLVTLSKKVGGGLGQIHYFELTRNNDNFVRKEGVKSSCYVFLVSK